MSFLIITLTILFHSLTSADDFQQVTAELQRQAIQTQQQIDPLVQEAAVLERQNADARAELERRTQKSKEILVQTEKLKGEIKTALTSRALEEILNVGTIGHCTISLGSMPNEYHLWHALDRVSIRFIFADETSQQHPYATLHSVDGVNFYKMIQLDFNPEIPTSTTGPMRADVRLDTQKKIVHAVFRGQTIKDKGPMGFFGSHLRQRGMTCLTMDAGESI